MTVITPLFDIEQVTSRAVLALEEVGVVAEDARNIATHLVTADARGLSSHGLSRLALYINRIRTGKMNAETQLTVVKDMPAAALIDGNNGIGIAVATRAMDLLAAKAQRVGVAVASVRRSNHFGMAGLIAERANEYGLIGYAASNGPARMPAYGARKPVFGTSPFACAVPTSSGEPIVVDMATCVVARGKIIMAARAGQSIPEGWALDTDGNPTTDPHKALEGSVVPFAGPKGSGIAMLIEIFAGVLGGDTWARGIQDMYVDGAGPSGTSHFLAAINIEAFSARDEFENNLDDLISQVKRDPASPVTPVYLPGERERQSQRVATESGVSLPPDVVQEVNKLLDSFGISPIEPKN